MNSIDASKDKPQNIIFNSGKDSIAEKIERAYCPIGVIEESLMLVIRKTLIFWNFDSTIIKREHRCGRNVKIKRYDEPEKLFADKKKHQLNLRNNRTRYLIEAFKPYKECLEKHGDHLRGVERLIEEIKNEK